MRVHSSLVAGIALILLGAGCESKEKGPIEPTYENVGKVIERSCALSNSCHGGTGPAKARLNFDSFTDRDKPFTQPLLNVASCEYSFMPRITPGDPDNSWLFQKLTRPTDPATGMMVHTPDAAWANGGLTPGEDGLFRPSVCPLVGRDGMISFGHVMPDSVDGSQPLESREIEMFRQWILMGAPGPGFDSGVPDSDAAVSDSGLDDSTLLDAAADATATPDANLGDSAIDAETLEDSGADLDSGSTPDSSTELDASSPDASEPDSGSEVDSGAVGGLDAATD